MNEIERIQEQLKRAMEGDAWHGPSVRQLLHDVTASQAAAHPIENAHSIWELTLHIAAWNNAARRRLGGDRAELPDEEDWPAVTETSDAAWNEVIAKLDQSHRELHTAIGTLNSDNLDLPILDDMPSVYVTLQGVIQHCLYHAGQIAMLKKMKDGVKNNE